MVRGEVAMIRDRGLGWRGEGTDLTLLLLLVCVGTVVQIHVIKRSGF